MRTLKDLFLDELADMYDAEHRIVKALPKLAAAAASPHLRKALLKHLKETEGHVKNLEKVFASFGQKAKAKKCHATVGLLEEGDEIAGENKGSPTLDAALISAGQKVEHYEIASYGTLREWATLLGNDEAADLIEEILDQEKAADSALGELARTESNEKALVVEEHSAATNGGAFKTRARKNGSPVHRRQSALV
jgi:ferritin-like metal-binding protein YciE